MKENEKQMKELLGKILTAGFSGDIKVPIIVDNKQTLAVVSKKKIVDLIYRSMKAL